MNTIRTFADAVQAADSAALHIMSLLRGIVAERPANLAISGGSTPRLMFDSMARQQQFPWDRVHLFWVDERAVPPDDPQSNYRLANEHLIQPAAMPAANVHRVLAEMQPEDAARRYVLDIQEHFGIGAGQIPQFDVVHQGIGPDAHTASLFPGEPLIEDRTNVAAAVYVEKMSQWRITFLPGVLLAARHTVMLAAGADKADAAFETLEGPYDPLRFPAQLVARHGIDVCWFLDRAAASRIGE